MGERETERTRLSDARTRRYIPARVASIVPSAGDTYEPSQNAGANTSCPYGSENRLRLATPKVAQNG